MEFEIIKDQKGLQQALFDITHGLYIVTAARGGRLNGQCLDALMQVTSHPPRIAISMRKTSLTHEMVSETGFFAVNVLCRDEESCDAKIKHFGMQSGRNVEKFQSVPYELGINGAPLLPDCLAFFECSVIRDKTVDLGTHTLFIAEITRSGFRPEGEPLTYCEYRKRMKK